MTILEIKSKIEHIEKECNIKIKKINKRIFFEKVKLIIGSSLIFFVPISIMAHIATIIENQIEEKYFSLEFFVAWLTTCILGVGISKLILIECSHYERKKILYQEEIENLQDEESKEIGKVKSLVNKDKIIYFDNYL